MCCAKVVGLIVSPVLVAAMVISSWYTVHTNLYLWLSSTMSETCQTNRNYSFLQRVENINKVETIHLLGNCETVSQQQFWWPSRDHFSNLKHMYNVKTNQTHWFWTAITISASDLNMQTGYGNCNYICQYYLTW